MFVFWSFEPMLICPYTFRVFLLLSATELLVTEEIEQNDGWEEVEWAEINSVQQER